MRRVRSVGLSAVTAFALLACDDGPTEEPLTADPPAQGACPSGLPVPATCYRGVSSKGAAYVIAVPETWNGNLVLFNRGATPVPLDSQRVFGASRFLLRDSVALAASAYRSTTPLAREAAEDVEELRRIFVRAFGPARRTLVWGNSFGALVARCAELYSAYDGALLGCGTIASALQNYYPLLDLRLVYQYYCRNLPRPEERQYDLYYGLDPQSSMAIDEVRTRANECTGISLPVAQRSVLQRQKLANILAAVRFPESGLLTNLEASTILLKILVQDELGGRNPLANQNVRYTGTADDDALNAGIARYTANAQAVASLTSSDNLTGRVRVPVVTLHAIDDPRAYVENEAAYRATLQKAGSLDRLLQLYTSQGGHCSFGTESVAAFDALMRFVETRSPPTVETVAGDCERRRGSIGGACRFNATYQPASLDTRVYPR